MITIILAIVLGVAFTVFAVDNNQSISINLLGVLINLPIYLLLAISFLIGTFLTAITSVYDWTFTAFDLKKKENNYKNAISINESLRKDISRLNSENQRLKEEVNTIKSVNNERKIMERKEHIKNFFYRLTHPGSHTQSDLA